MVMWNMNATAPYSVCMLAPQLMSCIPQVCGHQGLKPGIASGQFANCNSGIKRQRWDMALRIANPKAIPPLTFDWTLQIRFSLVSRPFCWLANFSFVNSSLVAGVQLWIHTRSPVVARLPRARIPCTTALCPTSTAHVGGAGNVR